MKFFKACTCLPPKMTSAEKLGFKRAGKQGKSDLCSKGGFFYSAASLRTRSFAGALIFY